MYLLNKCKGRTHKKIIFCNFNAHFLLCVCVFLQTPSEKWSLSIKMFIDKLETQIIVDH